jgi:Flp pilus assembly pilin Flp
MNKAQLKDLKELDVKRSIKPDKEPRSIMNQIMVEYGLLIALISMILIILLGTAGEEINHLWSRINSGISVENR